MNKQQQKVFNLVIEKKVNELEDKLDTLSIYMQFQMIILLCIFFGIFIEVFL